MLRHEPWGLNDFLQPIMMMRPAVTGTGTWHPWEQPAESKEQGSPGWAPPRRALSGTRFSQPKQLTLLHNCDRTWRNPLKCHIRQEGGTRWKVGGGATNSCLKCPIEEHRVEPARQAQAMTFKWATLGWQTCLTRHTHTHTYIYGQGKQTHTYMISYKTYSWRIPWTTCCNAVAIFLFHNTVDQISIGLRCQSGVDRVCRGCALWLGGCFLWAASGCVCVCINAWHSRLAVLVVLVRSNFRCCCVLDMLIGHLTRYPGYSHTRNPYYTCLYPCTPRVLLAVAVARVKCHPAAAMST